MSSEDTKAVYQRYIDAWNSGDPADFDTALAPDFLDRVMGRSRDLAAVKSDAASVHRTYENFQVIVEDMIAEGDKVAARLSYRARHKRTGKEVNFEGLTFSRVRGDKVSGGWGVLDLGSLQRQLGEGVPMFD